MQPYRTALAACFMMMLAPSFAIAKSEALNCVALLAGPADKPMAERIAEAYETLLRGNGITPASIAEYAELATRAEQLPLPDFFRFRQAASPEQSVLQDGVETLGNAVLAMIEEGELSEAEARQGLAQTLRKITGTALKFAKAQQRTDSARTAPIALSRSIPLNWSVTGAIQRAGSWEFLTSASSDGRYFAFIKNRMPPTLYIVSTKTGKLMHEVVYNGHPQSLQFSPNGQYLVLTYGNAIDPSKGFSVWNAKTRKSWNGVGDLKDVTFSPDSKSFYAIEKANGTVKGYSLASGNEFFSVRTEPQSIAVTSDGQQLITMHYPNEEIILYDTKTQTERNRATLLNGADAFAFTGGMNGELLVRDAGDLSLSVWQLGKSAPKRLSLKRRYVERLKESMSPSRRYCLSQTRQGSLSVWDSERREFLDLEQRRDIEPSWQYFYSGDESRLIGIASNAHKAIAWDLSTGRFLGEQHLPRGDWSFLTASRDEAFSLGINGVIYALNLNLLGQ